MKKSKINGNHLTKIQELKKKKMLLKMKKEIEKLEFNKRHLKISNFKNKIIRDFNISMCTVRLVAPYALTAGITFGALSLTPLGMPFIMDNKKQKKETKQTIDSFGKVKYEEQYGAFKDYYYTISYFGKWKPDKDSFYSREVISYSTTNVSDDKVEKAVNDNEINSLEDIFGKPISKKTEKQNNLTNDEINKEPYLEANLYSKNNSDYIYAKETVGENVTVTALWLIITLLCEYFPLSYRADHPDFDYYERIDNINYKYSNINIKELEKKLEIKKANYYRLTR